MSPFTEFALRLDAGIPIITTTAVLDIANADDLRVALLSATALGYATIVVDLSDNEFCDSAAMRELERAHYRAIGEGGEVRLVVPGARLQRLFDVAGLGHVIRLYRTMTAALAELPAIAIVPPDPAVPADPGSSGDVPTDTANGSESAA